MTAGELWEYSHNQADWAGGRLIGYSVEARDGGIGKIDSATTDAGAHSIVVDTGPWIFGRKVMLPAGLIDRVEHGTKTAYVNCTKDEVKDGPEYTDDSGSDMSFTEKLSDYWRRERNPS